MPWEWSRATCYPRRRLPPASTCTQTRVRDGGVSRTTARREACIDRRAAGRREAFRGCLRRTRRAPGCWVGSEEPPSRAQLAAQGGRAPTWIASCIISWLCGSIGTLAAITSGDSSSPAAMCCEYMRLHWLALAACQSFNLRKTRALSSKTQRVSSAAAGVCFRPGRTWHSTRHGDPGERAASRTLGTRVAPCTAGRRA